MRFRKKPVVIEAVQFDGTRLSCTAISKWMLLGRDYEAPLSNMQKKGYFHMEIDTLEGTMVASPGDWIIKGVKGEFYPCKPDIFEATYEPVTEAAK
jgi:hypothetical protein